eukprot:4146303-Prymnesium_polylepis.1
MSGSRGQLWAKAGPGRRSRLDGRRAGSRRQLGNLASTHLHLWRPLLVLPPVCHYCHQCHYCHSCH